MDGFNCNDRPQPLSCGISRKLAKGSFLFSNKRLHHCFENDLGIGRKKCTVRVSLYYFNGLSEETTDDAKFVFPVRTDIEGTEGPRRVIP